MKMSHKHQLINFFLIFAVSLSMLQPFSASAATSLQVILTPHVLSDGSENDFLKENLFRFTSDGESITRLEIPQNGSVCISLHTERAGFIITEMYENPDASGLPVYLQAQCTADRGNTGTITRYLSKGTYYLRFPENTYEASILLYPCKNQTWKNGSSVVIYNDYKHESIFTYKAPSNGYFTVSGKILSPSSGSLSAVLCNAKGIPLTEKALFSDLQSNKVTYAVKKGTTYKLRTTGLNVNDSIYCQLRISHTAVNEKSGSTKKKAVSVSFGNKVSGTVFAEDSATKADWYKIKNPKKQQLLLNYSGSITSGSLMMDVYDAKGKKLDSYSVISNIGEKKEDLMHNADGGTKMPAGTYYLRVTKSRKTSTGIYSFSLSGK